jgi:hypothetical protein
MVVVTREHKVPVDAFIGYKPLEQRRRKLDGLPAGAMDKDMLNGPAIIIQILLRRDVEIEFVAAHTIVFLLSIAIG